MDAANDAPSNDVAIAAQEQSMHSVVSPSPSDPHEFLGEADWSSDSDDSTDLR